MEFGANPLMSPGVLSQFLSSPTRARCVTLKAGEGLGLTPKVKAGPAGSSYLLWAGGRHKTSFLCSLEQRKTLSMNFQK